MKDILYLVHRLPYPPNKGDKIRSFNLLKHLAASNNVHLGCFVDDRADYKYIADLDEYCASVSAVPLNAAAAKFASLRGLLSSEALSVPYYASREMHRWVRETIENRGISAVVCFSSPMAQFVAGTEFEHMTRIMDLVDIDSDKWRQYAKQSRWPKQWIYAREARLLADYERTIAADFDAVLFVSDGEADMFTAQVEEFGSKVHAMRNGVATDYFCADPQRISPYDVGSRTLVFTGMMNYWPNEDATRWFAESVLPLVRSERPDAEFWIVGAQPSRGVQQLATLPGVQVTGAVDDVRPYLQHADLVVAPLRIARGVQNKVLEALAMGKRVVCTPDAAFGLHSADEAPLDVAADATGFAASVLRALEAENSAGISAAARDYVLAHYDWPTNLSVIDSLLDAAGVARTSG